MDRAQGSFAYDASGGTGAVQLVQDILGNLVVIQPFIVIVDRDPLAEGLVDRFAQDIVQMGFPAEDEGKIVHGIIPVIHQHLDIIQDPVVKVLCFIDRQEERLAFVPVQVGDLLLDRLKHRWFPAFVGNAEYGTELLVKVSDADRRQAHIFHMELVRVQAFGETAEGIGFPHARERGEYADPPDILQMVEADVHFAEVPGAETVLFF